MAGEEFVNVIVGVAIIVINSIPFFLRRYQYLLLSAVVTLLILFVLKAIPY